MLGVLGLPKRRNFLLGGQEEEHEKLFGILEAGFYKGLVTLF